MDNLRGSILMVLAMLGFAIEDMLIKLAAVDIPAGQVMIILGIGGGIIFACMAKVSGATIWNHALLHPAALLRNACEVAGTVGFVSAITLMPISTASAILQATPLVVTLGAALFLGEDVGWRRWAAILIGLGGVLLIIRPGMEGFDTYSLFAVLGVVGLAGRDLATRRIPRGISSIQIAFSAFMISIVTGMLLLWIGVTGTGLVWLDSRGMVLLIGAIVVGVLAYYAIVNATRIGDIAVVSPYRYSRLVFALVVGAIVFAERPDAMTLFGAAIIVCSGIYTLWRETRLRRASLVPKPAL